MKYLYVVFFITVCLPSSMQDGVVLSHTNIDQYLKSKQVMLVNFYADWCRFSAALKPIYDKAATQIHSETDKAALGKVDCEVEKYICQQVYRITKYPTIKIFRNGEIMRKEYRGQRSVEAFVSLVRKELRDPLEVVATFSEVIGKVKDTAKSVVGEFSSNASVEYQNFNKVAIGLKDDCRFFAVVDQSNNRRSITFKESSEVKYEGSMESLEEMKAWLSEQCVPMVREITFENGEEMTEEGLPFLILFYHPDHPETKDTFKQRVLEEVPHEKGNVNFVTADGIRFAHPLSHLGKSKKDLPMIAIDSFKHMYVFPNFEDINVPGKLKQFVDDLHSGKLHRDFHNMPPPPDPHHPVKRNVPNTPPQPSGNQPSQQQPSDPPANRQAPPPASSPPESTFKKLQPARSRYTLLKHDEL